MSWPQIILAYLGVAAFLAVPIIAACFLVDGFRKGGMLAKGKRYYRTVDPIQFWVLAGMNAALVIAYGGLLAYVGVDYLTS
jgi:uncharacterized membrane protein